jgi:hypothetical protein
MSAFDHPCDDSICWREDLEPEHRRRLADGSPFDVKS